MFSLIQEESSSVILCRNSSINSLVNSKRIPVFFTKIMEILCLVEYSIIGSWLTRMTEYYKKKLPLIFKTRVDR
jgi:hypothetical protein